MLATWKALISIFLSIFVSNYIFLTTSSQKSCIKLRLHYFSCGHLNVGILFIFSPRLKIIRCEGFSYMVGVYFNMIVSIREIAWHCRDSSIVGIQCQVTPPQLSFIVIVRGIPGLPTKTHSLGNKTLKILYNGQALFKRV